MSSTYAEILNQPRSWEQTLAGAVGPWPDLAARLVGEPRPHVLFVGCGTSLYVAQCAAHTFQEVTGCVAAAVPGSEVFLSPASTIPPAVPLVAFLISRSGETSEVIAALDHLRQRPETVATVAVTCAPNSELAARASAAIELPHADDRSIVMSQSCTNMLLALQVVAALVAGDGSFLAELRRLPTLLGEGWQRQERFAEELGRDLARRQFVFLGLGPNAPLAQEGTLKLKEMTQTPCEAYNALEFRHGPISIVQPGTTVVMLAGERVGDHTAAVAADVEGFGGSVALLRPGPGEDHRSRIELELPAGLSDVARCVLYLPALQLLAYHRAVALGLDPDRPRNLTRVVTLAAS